MNFRTILFSAAAILGMGALGSSGFAQTAPNVKPVAGGSYNQMKKDQRQAGIGPAPKNGMRPGGEQAVTEMRAPKSPAVQGGSYSQMKRDKFKAGLGPEKSAMLEARAAAQKDTIGADGGMPGKITP